MTTMTIAHAGEIGVLLKDRYIINSAAFSLQPSSEQTKILAANKDNLPVEFFPDFNHLQDRQGIVEKILKGQDVSLELEFNGIELTEEESTALKAILPVLEKIKPIPSYPWLTNVRRNNNIVFGTNEIRRDGYAISKRVAKRIWETASKHWAGGPQPPRGRTRISWDTHTIIYNSVVVAIGCQRVPRADWEAAAKHYGWAPVLPDA